MQKFTFIVSALFITAGMYLFATVPDEVTHSLSLILVTIISGWAIGVGLLLLIMGVINK